MKNTYFMEKTTQTFWPTQQYVCYGMRVVKILERMETRLNWNRHRITERGPLGEIYFFELGM